MRLAKCSNAWAQCTLGRGKFGARVNNTIPWYVIVSWRSNAGRLKHIRKNLPPWKLCKVSVEFSSAEKLLHFYIALTAKLPATTNYLVKSNAKELLHQQHKGWSQGNFLRALQQKFNEVRELPKTYKHTLIILSLFSHYSLIILSLFSHYSLIILSCFSHFSLKLISLSSSYK